MEHGHVLCGLIRKRSEIAGEIERQQHALRKLVIDLDAINSAILIFDPEAGIGAIKPVSYPHKHAAFWGEMMRFVMDTLRTAKGKPVKTKEIALNVAKGRGLREDDAKLWNTLRKRVGACIFKLKRDGHVREIEGTGGSEAVGFGNGRLDFSPLLFMQVAHALSESYHSNLQSLVGFQDSSEVVRLEVRKAPFRDAFRSMAKVTGFEPAEYWDQLCRKALSPAD